MVDILLASYNGEKYIETQIESILNQTYKNFRILIRDDNSTDLTVNIIKKLIKKNPKKIFLIEDEKICGSAVKNFFHLLKYAESDYIMFADQDDFWLPNKIEISLKAMKKIEKYKSANTPILVYANYKVVDDNLKDLKFKINKSQIESNHTQLNRLLVQNYVTGCLIMMNRSLCKYMGEYDHAITMHDAWAALCASAFGEIYHIDDEVMLYRQHSNNCVGAINVKSFNYRMNKFLDKDTKNKQFVYVEQAKCFYARYKDDLNECNRECLLKFIKIVQYKSKIHRILALIRGNYLKSDIVRKIGQIYYI